VTHFMVEREVLEQVLAELQECRSVDDNNRGRHEAILTLQSIISQGAATSPAQPAPEQEPSTTSGMNMARRILHVGGRNNAAGCVEFGSIQAVEALVRHVLRDLSTSQPASVKADKEYTMDDWFNDLDNPHSNR
jgi:hypothetical protein